MITEDYVSCKVAKLLAENGFDIPCKYAWHGGIKEPDFHRHSINFNGGDYKDLRTKWYSAPTPQMAMKWLREKHGFHISVSPYLNEEGEVTWVWEIIDIETAVVIADSLDDDDFNSCEEAVDTALKHCLTKLI